MLHIALLHCSKLFIINKKYYYFSLNLQSLTTDFISHHNASLAQCNKAMCIKVQHDMSVSCLNACALWRS